MIISTVKWTGSREQSCCEIVSVLKLQKIDWKLSESTEAWRVCLITLLNLHFCVMLQGLFLSNFLKGCVNPL